MNPSIPLVFSRRALSRPLAVLTLAFTLPLASPPSLRADGAEPKTHTLFMGVDFAVEYQHQFYHVRDVEGGSFVIRVDGKDVKVPANWTAVKIKVDRSLKLSPTSVAVGHLVADRAYTPGNDPVKKYNRQNQEVMAAEEALSASVSRQAAAEVSVTVGKSVVARATAAGQVAMLGMPTADPAKFERDANAGQAALAASYNNNSGFIGQMQSELAKENFDAIDVTFDVSAAKPIAHPYAVVMAEYRARDAKPNEASNWLYATELQPITEKVRKIHIKQGGFPEGYALQKFQVHLYDGPDEVATSVGDKQVPLTRREAFAYLLLEYLGSHKGATLTAAPAMGRPDDDVRAKLSPEQLDTTYYVKVSKDGLPAGVYADSACSRPIEGTVAATVQDVRFYPALENGAAVEGVAKVRLSRLAL